MTLELSCNLLAWLKLFWNNDDILIYKSLSDAYFLNQVFRKIDPNASTNYQLSLKPNILDKVKNWEILLKNMRTFYAEQLHQFILARLPNVMVICRDINTEKSTEEINKAIILILVAAVQCDRKESFIDEIQTKFSDESIGQGLMSIISQAKTDSNFIIDFSNYSNFSSTDLIGKLRHVIDLREDSYLKDNKNLLLEIIALNDQKNSGPVKSDLDDKLIEKKFKLKYVLKELDEKNDIICDLRDELEKFRKENFILKEGRQNESLRILQLKDELDCQTQLQTKVPIVELENRKLKEKLNSRETRLDKNLNKIETVKNDFEEKLVEPMSSKSEISLWSESDVDPKLRKSNSTISSSEVKSQKIFSRSKSERRHSDTNRNNPAISEALKKKELNISALQRRISSMTFRDKELSNAVTEMGDKYQLLEEKYSSECKLRNAMVKYFREIIAETPSQDTAEEINKLIFDNATIASDIQFIEQQLFIIKDKVVAQDNELLKLQIQCEELRNENVKLKVTRTTLRTQFDSVSSENESLKNQISTNDKNLSTSVGQQNDMNKVIAQMQSEFDSCKSQNATLAIELDSQLVITNTLKLELDRHVTKNTSLGIELEKELANSAALKSELDRQISQSTSLTLQLDALTREQEKMITFCATVKQQKEILEKANICLAEDNARRVSNLRIESATKNEEYNLMIQKYDEMEVQLKNTIDDNRSLLCERQKNKEEIVKLKELNYKIVTKADEMEQEVGKLADKIQCLIAYNDELTTGHSTLLHQMKSMVLQNQELLSEILQSKQDHFTEENTLRNKINQLEWQKEYLDSKISSLNSSNPFLSRKNSVNIRLSKSKEDVKRKDSGTITDHIRTSYQTLDDGDDLEVESFEKEINTSRKQANSDHKSQKKPSDSTVDERRLIKSQSVSLGHHRSQYSPESTSNNAENQYFPNKATIRRSPKAFEDEEPLRRNHTSDKLESNTSIDVTLGQKGFKKSKSMDYGHQIPRKKREFESKHLRNSVDVETLRSRSTSEAPEYEYDAAVPAQSTSYHNSLYSDPTSKDCPITRLPVKKSIFPYRPELMLKKSSVPVTDRVEEECGYKPSKRNKSPNPGTVKSTNNQAISVRSNEISPREVRPAFWTKSHSTEPTSNDKFSARKNSEKSTTSSASSKTRSKSPFKQS